MRRDELRALYQAMRTDELIVLRNAFILDVEDGADRVFCEQRIGLIDSILFERARGGRDD